jgi:hypothetical protein
MKKKNKPLVITKEKLVFNEHKSHSWFDIKIANINTDIKVNNKTKKEKNNTFIRTKTYRILPTKKQQRIIKKWIILYNYSYNKTVKFIRTNKDTKINFIQLRPLIKKSFNIEIKKLINKYKIPSHTIDYAIKDVVTAYKSAFKNLENKNIKYFSLRYKKLKSPRQSLTLEDSAFSKDKNTFCSGILGKFIKSIPENILTGISKTCRLTHNIYTNNYYINIPYDIR